MNNEQENKLPIKPYSLKELAGIYGVTKNTFKKWLQLYENDIGKRNGNYYSNNQVKTIFEKLGEPEVIKKIKS